MSGNRVAAAFDAEAAALREVTDGLTAADLARPSPCPPWTVGELLCHVLIATGRVRQALDEPSDDQAQVIRTADYYRPDHRFSAVANSDRVDAATTLANQLGSAAAITDKLARLTVETSEMLHATPADRTVQTRHGDRMLLPDFGRTRVVELGVHGLDLASGLGRQPWLTRQAGDLIEELVLPAADGAEVAAELGCDQAGLIARLTGRIDLSAVDAAVLRRYDVTKLALA